MLDNNEIQKWLLAGDVSIQYQVYRDLLGSKRNTLQQKIEMQGWGLGFLSHRNENGHWGRGFYQPKWTSTHYTLLDLKNLNISPNNKEIKQTLDMILKNEKGQDGGINPSGTIKNSDVCINGMVLNYASYFEINEKELMKRINKIVSEIKKRAVL